MLSSEHGWYDRGREQFFFSRKVHLMSDTQEAWCDSLYFNRLTSNIRMLGNVQLNDTTRNVYALAGRLDYVDSLSTVTLSRDPAVVTVTEEEGQLDSVYFGADTLIHYTRQMFEIDSLLVAEAATRKKTLDIDPVTEFRRKAAEAAAKKAAEEAMNDPNKKAQLAAQQAAAAKAAADSLASLDSLPVTDSLSSGALADSLAVGDSLPAADSVSVRDSLSVKQKDTTKIGFVVALRNVKIFRDNMQVICDSLLYSDLDSLARLFKEPMIWNEVTQQYNADSISVVVRNNAMEKASLMSNAFIHIQEDSTHYDQIKGAEMMAYFGDDGQLSRFDALGGASALFYIEENGELATVNKKDSKMLSAIFRDGNIHRIYYFDTAVSDAYPVVQLSEEDRKLKGFNMLAS